MRIFILLILFIFSSCSTPVQNPPSFAYDLHLSSFEGSREKAIICFHGFGGDYRVAHTVEPFFKGKATVISFNFPDHGKRSGFFDPGRSSFGTIDEILPALYVLKQTIIDRGCRQVCLYGFSAGGAALVNCLSVLSNSCYDLDLRGIGIREAEKKRILKVLEKGDIILDTPLKSMDELVAFYGMTKELEVISARYRENKMDPIESIKNWKNLSLNILIHFQVPDEVLSNRDDQVFIERVKKYNLGKTDVLIGYDSGHLLPHISLWEYYLQKIKL